MPGSLIAYGLIALAILGTLGGIGWKIRASGYDACKVEWSQADEAARKREAELSAFAAKALADERKKRKTIIERRTEYVDRNIEKLVDSGQCLSEEGVKLLNESINKSAK